MFCCCKEKKKSSCGKLANSYYTWSKRLHRGHIDSLSIQQYRGYRDCQTKVNLIFGKRARPEYDLPLPGQGEVIFFHCTRR